MMRKALAAACILIFGPLCGFPLLSAQSANLSIAVSVPHRVIVGNGPIQLDVSITNHSHQLVLLPDVRGPAPISGVTIRDTGNGQYVRSRLESSGEWNKLAGSRFATPVPPGKTKRESLNLRRWFDLAPGDYSVYVKEKDPVTGDQIISNAVTFTVR